MSDLPLPDGYRIERGFLWPADDVACARAVFSTTDDADAAVALCEGRGTVIQAGGNMGVWPMHFSKQFDRVITFEPDPVNFQALSWNTAKTGNILALPCALGASSGSWCDLDREKGNAGAHQVVSGNVAPIVSVDSLAVNACDLIYLDIEGFELNALKGAAKTIARFRPVIAIEDKGLSERYGTRQGDAEQWLASEHGYKVHSRPRRDVILVG